MKKILCLCLCLLSFSAIAAEKRDLRKEAEKLTAVLNSSKPIPRTGLYGVRVGGNFIIQNNKDIYNKLSSITDSDYTGYQAEYFNNVVDAFLIIAELGNDDLKCFKNNISSKTRQQIAETYKILLDEGGFKMSDSAAVGIYQTMRLICDADKPIKEGIDNVVNELGKVYNIQER